MYIWLVVLIILKNMKVVGKDYSHILWKIANIFETTNQLYVLLQAPLSSAIYHAPSEHSLQSNAALEFWRHEHGVTCFPDIPGVRLDVSENRGSPSHHRVQLLSHGPISMIPGYLQDFGTPPCHVYPCARAPLMSSSNGS